MIQYKLEISPLSIRIQDSAIKRVIYLDTLKEDPSILQFLKKRSFRDSTQGVEVSLESLQLFAKTGRLVFKNHCLKFDHPKKLYWKEVNGSFSAILGDIPLEECQHVAFGWALHGDKIIPIATEVAWKWVELFLKGAVVLEGAQKRKFLDEDPPIISKQVEVVPELVLTDATGCFAILRHGDEKDLLEAGFIRKVVGKSSYYCPHDKVHETLALLLAVGWKIFASSGKQVLSQTSVSWDVSEEKGKIAICGKVHFNELNTCISKVGGLFVEMETAVGLIDRKKFAEMKGEWVGEKLIVKKGTLPFLEGDSVKWQAGLQEMVEGLRRGEKVELSPPGDSFKGTLLPYQQSGVNWLTFLKKWGFSGLLADEMGLGKTVQVLAFFSLLRTNLPILVVAPSSLLYQWKQEIYRFLPSIPVSIYAGANRHLPQHQGIIITSYPILRLDEKILSATHFEAIVLDEANAIKTAGTLTAKAACKLKGNFRIALSGTPMENRFEELVSQFQFLMPNFQINDPKQIKPFILRRKKKDVEIELPEKIEQISWVEMNEAQEALYVEYLSKYRNGILAQAEVDRMEVLEAILRLRQICIDPRLVGDQNAGSKIERLLEDLDDRKTLVFSQFTSTLKLIADSLRVAGKKFLYLDGEMASEERARLVAQFQQDPDATIFLLSLKAGGVGLNLTAAENVFIMDPWWNDAVEKQAIDRAHRIGQKKSVFVKRYITPNTIEEKMLNLKEKKNEAAELLLKEEEIDLLSLF